MGHYLKRLHIHVSVDENLLTEERREETKHPQYAGHFVRANPIDKRSKLEHHAVAG